LAAESLFLPHDVAMLLAKSIRSGKKVSLLDHSAAVALAGRALFGSPETGLTRLGSRFACFFGLATSDAYRFVRNLMVACWLHDIGKANEGFQRAIEHAGSQLLRHEHISALLLCESPLDSWLRTALSDSDASLVVAAIAKGHGSSQAILPENTARSSQSAAASD
jgi:CRISPR-associated endonuclease/helicase Cas3